MLKTKHWFLCRGVDRSEKSRFVSIELIGEDSRDIRRARLHARFGDARGLEFRQIRYSKREDSESVSKIIFK